MGLGYKLGICFFVKIHFDYQEMFALVQKKTTRNVEFDDFLSLAKEIQTTWYRWVSYYLFLLAYFIFVS